jgi:DNA-binding transcriptional MerR regulator/methylmalonyl-CoA mutase cobalamin-binding subunit
MNEPGNRKSATRYPLRAVMRRTGLSADVIRAWERRYGAVTPTRSNGRQRLYTEDDVIRLSLLQRATSAGHSIGEIATLDADALKALIGQGLARETNGHERVASVLEDSLAATEAFDGAALEQTLKRVVLSLGAERFVDEIAGAFLREIGERWHAGTLSPAHEHLASQVVRRVLEWLGDAYDPGPRAPRIVVATPAGEMHELGAMVVAAAALSEGWKTIFLGPNLPADEIANAAERSGAELVALSVVYADDHRTAEEVRQTARRLPEDVSLLVGGAAAERLDIAGRRTGVQVIGDVVGFRRELRARLQRRPGPEPAE